jgi:hypothetical protein
LSFLKRKPMACDSDRSLASSSESRARKSEPVPESFLLGHSRVLHWVANHSTARSSVSSRCHQLSSVARAGDRTVTRKHSVFKNEGCRALTRQPSLSLYYRTEPDPIL